MPSLKICAVLSKYCYLVLIIVMKLEEVIDYVLQNNKLC